VNHVLAVGRSRAAVACTTHGSAGVTFLAMKLLLANLPMLNSKSFRINATNTRQARDLLALARLGEPDANRCIVAKSLLSMAYAKLKGAV
jgi:hypothetical protein